MSRKYITARRHEIKSILSQKANKADNAGLPRFGPWLTYVSDAGLNSVRFRVPTSGRQYTIIIYHVESGGLQAQTWNSVPIPDLTAPATHATVPLSSTVSAGVAFAIAAASPVSWRLTGFMAPTKGSGMYTLLLSCGNGLLTGITANLWFDSALVISSCGGSYTPPGGLISNNFYHIRIEISKTSNVACQLNLSWITPSSAIAEFVPFTALYRGWPLRMSVTRSISPRSK
jgi:hypothetical protein